MLKRDNMIFGALMALVLPCLFYGLLWLISLFVGNSTSLTWLFTKDKMMLLAIFINLFPLRTYFVRYKFENTGRGILLMTFLLMVAYFLYKRYS